MKIEIVKIEKGDIILVQGEWVTTLRHIQNTLKNV
jgi:hypothetical protein